MANKVTFNPELRKQKSLCLMKKKILLPYILGPILGLALLYSLLFATDGDFLDYLPDSPPLVFAAFGLIGFFVIYFSQHYAADQRVRSENLKYIEARVDEITDGTVLSVEDGVVVSSETIPVVATAGGFSGGGGQISTNAGGYTSGNIDAIHGSFSSSTTLISKFFIKTENAVKAQYIVIKLFMTNLSCK